MALAVIGLGGQLAGVPDVARAAAIVVAATLIAGLVQAQLPAHPWSVLAASGVRMLAALLMFMLWSETGHLQPSVGFALWLVSLYMLSIGWETVVSVALESPGDDLLIERASQPAAETIPVQTRR